MQVFIFSHTHWDREWYLSQNQFQYRLIRTVDEIIDAIVSADSFNAFVLDGQTSIIDDYLEIRPERAELLGELIASGKLLIGPWYTMPDVFLPDGESLIRNLARGWQDCRRWGAPFPNVGYIPDSFGHIEQIPQILRGVGIDNFEFSRGLPTALSSRDDFHREFIWQAPDGSRVVAIHLPSGYHGGMFLPPPADREDLVARIRSLIEGAGRHTLVPDVVLIPHGIDHCWLQRDMGEILDVLRAEMPDVTIHHGALQDFVDACKERLPESAMVAYQGQLRGHLGINELHGTLSSRVDTKIGNELAQMHLENLAEPLDAIARRFGKPGSASFLTKAWKGLFQNHAHDSICGCSQDRVHDDVNTRFRETVELGIDIADGSLDYLNNNSLRDGIPTAIAYAGLNGGNRLVNVVVRLPEPPGPAACFADDSGRLYPVQFDEVLHMKTSCTNGEVIYVECRGCLYIPDLQPCEVRRLTYRDAGSPQWPQPVVASSTEVRNGLIALTAGINGSIDLTDLRTGATYAGIHLFAHDCDMGGGYHFEPVPRMKRRDTRRATASTRIVYEGPLRATLEVTTPLTVPALYDRETGHCAGQRTLRFVSRFTVEAGSPLVKVHTTVDNTTRHQRLRLVLPTGSRTDTVSADASFAVHDNSPNAWPGDAAQQSHPMRSFASVADGSRGLSIITKGLHEYAIAADASGHTSLEVTLLRSVDSTVLCSTWMTPAAQLLGPQEFEYALAIHSGDWRQAGIPQAAVSFRHPPIANVHGDHPLSPDPFQAHADIGYCELRHGREIMRDTNRSPWKAIHSQRDGWKRLERDRFVDGDLPHQIVPFRLVGSHLALSAYKRADDDEGEVLRFWNWADGEQTVSLRLPPAASSAARTDLLEQPTRALPIADHTVALRVRPYEIVTVRWQ